MAHKHGKNPEEVGLKIPESKYNEKRDFKIRECPACEEMTDDQGKQRVYDDNSVSVNMVKGVANCKRCGTTFGWKNRAVTSSNEEVSYDLPKDVKFQKLGDEAITFLKSRGLNDMEIINGTVRQVMRYDRTVKKEVPWIAFPYYKRVDDKDVLINVKYRAIKDKQFAQEKNGEPSLWLSHLNFGAKNVVITEGEFDTLAIMCALGVDYMKKHSIAVHSVNGGAINESDKNVDGKLKGFSLSYESTIANAETVILATDRDIPGMRLKEELKARIDKNIKVMSFGPYKDANDLLLEMGKEAVAVMYRDAQVELPEGVSRLDDFRDKMWDLYKNGLKEGTTTYFPEVDKMWRWRNGEVNVGTGYANEGKTTLFLHLCMIAAVFEPERVFLVFSPENIPQEEFYEELIHSFMGLPTDIKVANRMTPEQYEEAMNFMNKHFLLLYPTKINEKGMEEENFTVDVIERKVIETKRTDNITDVIIDPYNMVEHDLKISDREDLYISKFMTRLKRIALRCNVSVTLIAHQVTPRPDHKTGNYPMPSMYTIKGGGTFADKADNVLIFWRPYRRKQYLDHIAEDHKKLIENAMYSDKDKCRILSSLIVLESEKIKKQKYVAFTGSVELLYDFRTARFNALSGSDDVVGSNPLSNPSAVPYEEQIAEIEEEYDNKKDIKIEEVPDVDEIDGDVPF
jgi:twinkle protein